MPDYAFRDIEVRKEIQELYENGMSVSTLAEYFGVELSSMYRELRRGYRDGELLPNGARKYDAELAQEQIDQSYRRRGRSRFPKLTKTTAKTLLKRELGIYAKELNSLSDTPTVQIFECSLGRFLVRVSNDWFSQDERIVLEIGDPNVWGWGTIHKSFQPGTLEPDYEADERYWREKLEEVCAERQNSRGLRPHGYWTPVQTEAGGLAYECSCCQQEQRRRTKLCPCCWAEMDG